MHRDTARRATVPNGVTELRHRRLPPLLWLLSLLLALPLGTNTPGGPGVSISLPERAGSATHETARRTPDGRADPLAPHRAAAAVLAPLPEDTDLLLVEPAGILDSQKLARALGRLGYITLPASPYIDAVRVRVPAGAAAGALAARLAASGLAASVEPDVRVRASRVPDDPLIFAQRPYLDVIRAPDAWDSQSSAARVTIAVVDTGIDTSHADLTRRIAYSTTDRHDGLDEDGNGCIDDIAGCSFVSPAASDPSCGYVLPGPHGGGYDDEGHGTFVAGIAAAAGGNGVGSAGIAWDARLLPVKVLDCTATGRVSDAAAGIRYAARSGARIIIVAFGSPTDSRVLREAIAEAVDQYGALIVASAGNESGARVQFPAAYPGVLAVGGSGAIRPDGTVDYLQLASFSNVGPELALLAPAARIVAPLPAPSCGLRGWVCIEGQPYARASGTSFAVPLVAGAAALLLDRDPELRPLMLIALLRSGAQQRTSGPPLLDVAGALDQRLYTLHGAGISRAATTQASGADTDRVLLR